MNSRYVVVYYFNNMGVLLLYYDCITSIIWVCYCNNIAQNVLFYYKLINTTSHP
jgi:hypothetical protein